MDSEPEKVDLRKRRKGARRWWLLVLLLLAVGGLLVAHATIGEWLARVAMERLVPRTGWEMDAVTVEVGLFEPVTLGGLTMRSVGEHGTVTEFSAEEMTITLNSLGEALFGGGRVVSRLDCLGGALRVDLREARYGVRQGRAGRSAEAREDAATRRLRFLPETVAIRGGDVRVEGRRGSAQLKDLDGAWSEATSSELRVAGVELNFGGVRYARSNLRSRTEWRDGMAVLADARLADGVNLRSLAVSLVDPEGPSASVDVSVEDGSLRGDLGWGRAAGLGWIDLALTGVDLPMGRFARAVRSESTLVGTLREGRASFHGNPGRLMDSEIAIRLEVDDLSRRGETWDSLVVGANFIGRRLYVSNLELAAGENRIVSNGEIKMPRGEEPWAKADFFMNLSVDLRELRKLTAFTGDWWGEMGGRVALDGSIAGKDGVLDGYVNGEASRVTFRNLPATAMKLSAVVKDRELQVRSAEVWSGADRVMAKGSIDLAGERRYTGDVSVKVGDVARFTGKLGGSASELLQSGGLEMTWQGDGTWTSHSGVFRAVLADAATTWTPTGVTGEFAGTYSPENFHFSEVRLQNGGYDLNSRLTISSAGVNFSDLSLRRGRAELMTGEAFVPVNPFAILRGDRIADAFDLKKPVYARVTSLDVPLAELVAMAGQDAVAEGALTFHLTAEGPLSKLALSGELTGRDLSATTDQVRFPKTSIDLGLTTADQRMVATGKVNSKGFQPMEVAAEMPLVFATSAGGKVSLVDASTPITARVKVPSTSLQVVGAMMPWQKWSGGTLAGEISVGGTVGDPKFAGELAIRDGRFEFRDNGFETLSDLGGRILLDGSGVRVVDGFARVAKGELRFGANWSPGQKRPLKFELSGERVPVAAFGWRGLVEGSLKGAGSWSAGSVSGNLRLADGVGADSLRIDVDVPTKQQKEAAVLKKAASRWTSEVGVRIRGGSLAGGTVTGDLRLFGPLNDLRPVGELTVANVAVETRAGWRVPAGGSVHWRAQGEREPLVAVGGSSRLAGREIRYWAAGPLNDLEIWLWGVSDPTVVESLPPIKVPGWRKDVDGLRLPGLREIWLVRGQVSTDG